MIIARRVVGGPCRLGRVELRRVVRWRFMRGLFRGGFEGFEGEVLGGGREGEFWVWGMEEERIISDFSYVFFWLEMGQA